MSAENQQQSKIERLPVGDWLSRPFVWRIPVYQRHYSWANVEAGPLHLFWEIVEKKIRERVAGKPTNPHYLGVVLVDNRTPHDSTTEEKEYDVVDGQQRLTTIQIILAAFIKVMRDHDREEQIQNELEKYFFRGDKREQRKLNPTNFDKRQFWSIIFDVYGIGFNDPTPDGTGDNPGKSKVQEAFNFFHGKLSVLVDELDSNQDIDNLKDVIKNVLLDDFDLVLITLRKTDDAQKVFESMNNTAERLTFFDLIRNDVFYRASKEPGDDNDLKLFNSRLWQQLEKPFWEESSGQRALDKSQKHIEAYVARMLVAKLPGESVKFNRTDILHTYKTKFVRKYNTVREEVAAMVEYAPIYKYVMSQPVKNPVNDNFKFGIFEFKKWPNKDFYPVIFTLLSSDLSDDEKQKSLKLLENYVIRRDICRLSVAAYNKTAPILCKKLGDSPEYGLLKKAFTDLGKAPTNKFPTDEEVKTSCQTLAFYPSPFKKYVLEKVNETFYSSYDEISPINLPIDKLTVDHIMPRGWESNSGWMDQFNEQTKGLSDAEKDQKKSQINFLIEAIGNLTLMSKSRNSSKSNRSFPETKKLLYDSTLRMNQEIAQLNEWNENSIIERGRKLADKICQIWPYDLGTD